MDSPAVASQPNVSTALPQDGFQHPADMDTEHEDSGPQRLSDDPTGTEVPPARPALTWTDVVSRNTQRRLRQQQSQHLNHPSSPQPGSSPIGTTPQCHSQLDKRLHRQPRLPPLPLDDYKVVLRPRTGLILAQWLVQCITNAISTAAQISDATQDRITYRIRKDQNLIVVSTPDLVIAKKIQQITTLNMSGKQYEVTAYIAVPDNSSKGVITGIAANTPTDELIDHLRSPNAEIIHARMMGKSTTALLTFAGLQVPHYVHYYGGEYRCRIYQPRHQVCRVCLKLGHRADVCPCPDTNRCSTCGAVNPVAGHDCVPRCANCHEDHPATDPRCPVRQRRPYNKAHVLRSLASNKRSPPLLSSATTADCTAEASAHQTDGPLQPSSTAERPLADPKPRSRESRSRSRSKSRGQRRGHRGRSLSHGQSRVPGCSREASDSRGNQAPPNFWPQNTSLKVSWAEQFPPLPSSDTSSPRPISTPCPTLTQTPTIRDELQAMRTELQVQFTATIQKLQADLDELRQQHTRALQDYTTTIAEIRTQLRTHHESLQHELRSLVIETIREGFKLAQPQPIISPLALPSDTHGERDHRDARRVHPYPRPTTDRSGNTPQPPLSAVYPPTTPFPAIPATTTDPQESNSAQQTPQHG